MIRMLSLTLFTLLVWINVPSHVWAAPSNKPVANNQKLQRLDKVLAIVNNDVITERDVTERIKIVKQQLRRTHAKIPSMANLRKQILQQLIDQTLQLQAADKFNITVDNETLNYAINNIAKRNDMTLTEFKTQLIKDGINYRDFRNAVREELIISRVQEREVKPRVVVTKQEVDNFLRAFKQTEQQHLEYRIEDILVSLPDSPSPEQIQQTKVKAQLIADKVRGGANFESTANAQSSGQQALNGGDLGWRSLARLPTVFANKVQHMKKGNIVGPIRTGNGFHIIKLVDIRGGTPSAHVITETKARHILIKPNAMMTDKQAKDKIASLRKQIANGSSFATLAKRYSQDPGSANKGGELGWVTDEELVPSFAHAMDKLAVNQLSQPVKTKFGWHLIQVEARRKKDATKQYQQQRIRDLIGQRKYEEAISVWIRQLRAQAYIKKLS